MTIYETLKKDRRINNDFDYRRAKVELSNLSNIYNTTGAGPVEKLQLFSDSVSEYERRTVDPFIG